MATKNTPQQQQEMSLPTELGLRDAISVYGWRALGLLLTFVPFAVLYIDSLVIAQISHSTRPKTTIALAVIILAAVGAGCYGIGSAVHTKIARMPSEVRLIVAPFVVIAAVLGAIVAVPIMVWISN